MAAVQHGSVAGQQQHGSSAAVLLWDAWSTIHTLLQRCLPEGGLLAA